MTYLTGIATAQQQAEALASTVRGLKCAAEDAEQLGIFAYLEEAEDSLDAAVRKLASAEAAQ